MIVREFHQRWIYLHSPLENKLSDGFVWYANPYSKRKAFWVGSRSCGARTKRNRHPLRSACLFLLVTRTGIEPMFSAWEANVLTAWPTGLAVFSLSIIQSFCHFVKGFLKDFLKNFYLSKLRRFWGLFSLFFTTFYWFSRAGVVKLYWKIISLWRKEDKNEPYEA